MITIGDHLGNRQKRDGVPFSVAGFTIRGGRIVAFDILADPERVARLDLSMLIAGS